jgi:hypothetical protein
MGMRRDLEIGGSLRERGRSGWVYFMTMAFKIQKNKNENKNNKNTSSSPPSVIEILSVSSFSVYIRIMRDDDTKDKPCLSADAKRDELWGTSGIAF